MDQATRHKRVVAALVRRDGKLLVCQRPKHKLHGDLWEFPGGKLEPGETLHEAATRELSEELSLNVRGIGEVRFTAYDADSGLTIEFVEVIAEGHVHLHEHQAFAWKTLDELRQMPLSPTDRRCAEFLMQNRGTM